MKLSLEWLGRYCQWSWSVEELVEKLTMSGTEVESVETCGVSDPHIVTARVKSFTKHPNADRLRLCKVDDGKGERQIVCGASNFKEGDVVPLALPGAVMGEGFTIKESKLRGELSQGMMCSGTELGLTSDSDGLMIMDGETPLGVALQELYAADTVLEIEVTPNRADLLSFRGVARELVVLGAEPKDSGESPKIGPGQGNWQVEVGNPGKCPRYTGVLIRGVKVGASPEWMRRRLEAVGLRAINNIVDITNYVLLEMGQPLHAFDAAKLASSKIMVRDAKEKEAFQALDGNTYELNPHDLVIADEKGAVALAGVMGGELSGVTESTVDVFLESAAFEPMTVRTTSRRLGLISDSSYRFERGVDPRLVNLASDRAVALILELAGGRVEGARVESAAEEVPECRVSFRYERAEQMLGDLIARDGMDGILESLGCLRSGGEWEIPSWRPDLTREIDLIEELARLGAHGRVQGILPRGVASETAADRTYRRNRVLAERLAGMGFQEVVTTSLVSAQEEDREQRALLSNPMNEDGACLRHSLLESVLPCVEKNLSRGCRDLRLFEIGKTAFRKGSRIIEQEHLLILVSGNERVGHWTEPGREMDFFSLKGVVEVLKAMAGKEIKWPRQYGMAESSLLKPYGIKQKVFAVEAVLESQARAKNPPVFQPLPAYPSVSRDLAFVVKEEVSQADVYKAIQEAKVDALESVVCFDLYQDPEGVKLSAGMKSLAYALTYRSAERTLKEKEVSEWDAKIVASVEKRTGGTLRA